MEASVGGRPEEPAKSGDSGGQGRPRVPGGQGQSAGTAPPAGPYGEGGPYGERPGPGAIALDSTQAHPARVYDAWLGGEHNYPVDREVAERAAEANPGITTAVRANRAFLGRAVRYLAGAAGIRQFLDIGTGIPAAANTHEVAQAAAPSARVVYVDNDPIVLTHARSLLAGSPRGRTDYVDADLREVEKILSAAGRTLDLSRPVGLMLVAVLQYVPDAEDPRGLVRRLLGALAPGSHLVVSHPASDIAADEVAASMRLYNAHAAQDATATPRARADVARFFDGTRPLDPGIVPLPEWRPDGGEKGGEGVGVSGANRVNGDGADGGSSGASALPVPMWCGVGRKP